jgi:ABC-type phosphate transport system substrate-binding protein
MRINAASLLALMVGLAYGSVHPDRRAWAQGADLLVMVVNKSNTAVPEMTKSDAKKLLLGEKTTWPNGGRVLVVLKPAGSADRAAVLEKICGMSEAEYTRYNLQAEFMGGTAAWVHQAASAVAVRSFVEANPGAVGFLRKSEVDDNLKAVWSLK